MKKALLIGSVTADVTLPVGHLPAREEDLNLSEQSIRPGGCAFNASSVFRLLHVPYTLAFPLGTGLFADYLEKELAKRGIMPFYRLEKENGACYCLIEENGDRTFLAVHGAEYCFDPQMFEKTDPAEYDLAYACGIDLEGETGETIAEVLVKMHDAGCRIVFAPGPRIRYIPLKRVRRILSLSPLLHLNRREACALCELLGYQTGGDGEKAAEILWSIVHECVIVTGGAEEVICRKKDGGRVSCMPDPAVQKDGTGAGDCHIGTIMAEMMQGREPEEAIRDANRISAAVIGLPGGEITPSAIRPFWKTE